MGDRAGEFCYAAYRRNDGVCDGCALAAAFRSAGIDAEVLPPLFVVLMCTLIASGLHYVVVWSRKALQARRGRTVPVAGIR